MDWENLGLGAVAGALGAGLVAGGLKLYESLSASRKAQEGLRKAEEAVRTGEVDPRFLKALGLSDIQEDAFPGLFGVGFGPVDASRLSIGYQACGLDTQPDARFQPRETPVPGSLMTRELEQEVLDCIQDQVNVKIPEVHPVIWVKPVSNQELRALAVRPGPGSYERAYYQRLEDRVACCAQPVFKL